MCDAEATIDAPQDHPVRKRPIFGRDVDPELELALAVGDERGWTAVILMRRPNEVVAGHHLSQELEALDDRRLADPVGSDQDGQPLEIQLDGRGRPQPGEPDTRDATSIRRHRGILPPATIADTRCTSFGRI